MNLDKYLKNYDRQLEISDLDGEITELPDDFFQSYTNIERLDIYGTELTVLPSSFSSLKSLVSLKLYKTKIKTLPDSISSLPELSVISFYTNAIDLNKEAEKLSRLPSLEYLDINGYRGTSFPANLAIIKALKRVRIGGDVKKKLEVKELISTLSKLPLLEELEINIPVQHSDIDETFLQLDSLTTFKGWFWPFLGKIEETPLIIGRTRHMSFDRVIDESVRLFRDRFKHQEVQKEILELLFGIHIKNYTALNKLLPNVLQTSLNEKNPANLILLDKPKGETIKTLKEKFASTGITIGSDSKGRNIVVVGARTLLEEADTFALMGYEFITVDHLKDVLVGLADPWLMQKDNESSNDQLLQLLASNQTENYLIAFQIIEGGGANKTIQSLLAAIMLSHPEAPVYKAAEKLYDRYGSQSFKLHVKSSKVSLRKSGDTERKLNVVVDHPDLDSFAFRLMHHCIAGSNKNIADVQSNVFRIKNVKDIEISEALPFFNHFVEVHFENCENLQLEKGIPLLKQALGCKVLNVNSCKISIPASIGELTQLHTLDLGFNVIEDPHALMSLKKLTSLNLEGSKIKEWTWLSSLTELEELNINNCALSQLPSALYSCKKLMVLYAKQNKFKEIDARITELLYLKVLDFSNNQLSAFPYFLAKLQSLSGLLLRSNSIAEFNSRDLSNAGNTKSFPWAELNLSRNELGRFSFNDLTFSQLRILDISHNSLAELDDSIFRQTTLRELYAEHNSITSIPVSISQVNYFVKLWLNKNLITKLEDYMARVRVENCDLSDNQITYIHPDFDVVGKENYGRLYWKIRNNPISNTLNNFGGLYGR